MQHFFPITHLPSWITGQHAKSTDDRSPIPDPAKWFLFPKSRGRCFILAIDSGIFFDISPDAFISLTQFRVNRNIRNLPSTVAEELGAFAKIGAFDPSPHPVDDSGTVTCLGINVCQSCNIDCSYCFARKGTYGSVVKGIRVATAQRAIDLLLDQLRSDQQANVVLFGGEPLLAKNKVIAVIDYGRRSSRPHGKEIIFDIFTNGTLLDERIGSLLADDPNIRVLLSLDGRSIVNDRHRRGCGVKGVARTVQENVHYLQAVPRERIVVRSTIADTKPRITERAEWFLEMGLTNLVFDPAFCRGVSGVPEAAAIYDAMCDELQEISDFLVERLRQRQKVSVNVLSETVSWILMNTSSAHRSCVSPCPAGTAYLSIDASGRVYPCHYFVGHQEYTLGEVVKNGLTQRSMLKDNGIQNLSRGQVPECKVCWLRNLCEGPCPYKWLILYSDGTDYRRAYCRYMRERVVAGLGLLSQVYGPSRYPYLNQWARLLHREVGIDDHRSREVPG